MRIVYSFHEQETVFETTQTSVVIGRATQSGSVDLDLSADPSVSHRHARIGIEAGQLWIEDLDSRFGTWVNDERIQGKSRRALQPGDQVRIGDTTLTRISCTAKETAGATILSREQAARDEFHLVATGVLEGLQPQPLTELESQGTFLQYENQLIAADGSPLGFFFVVLGGSFEVSKLDPQTQKKIVLAKLGEGECFGEMSFLTGAAAAANVMAVGRTVCWAIQHPALRQFVESNPAGNRLTINIALLLARRVQEGNTRLLGASASLSAYFGTQARASTAKTIEAPRATDHAEMEIPDEVFDSFVREVLNLPREAALTETHRDDVRRQIEQNQVDIVPWLEQAGHGKPLRVRLKFVEESPVPRMAVQTPAMAAPIPAQPRVLRVPQTRARIAPAAPVTVRPRSVGWKIGNVAGWAGLPILAVIVVVLWLPFQSREAIAQSNGFQRLPLQGLWQWLLVHAQTSSSEVAVHDGLWHEMEIEVSNPSRVTAVLKMPSGVSSPITVTARAQKKDSSDDPIQNRMTIVSGNQPSILLSARLSPGAYSLRFEGGMGSSDAASHATLIVTAWH